MWLIVSVLFAGAVAATGDVLLANGSNEGLKSNVGFNTEPVRVALGDILTNNRGIGLASATNEAFANSFIKDSGISSNENVELRVNNGANLAAIPTVQATTVTSDSVTKNANAEKAVIGDIINKSSTISGETENKDSLTNVPSVSLVAPVNVTTTETKDPLGKLSDKVLISKLRSLMRNEVCGDKPFKLVDILPDLLQGAKAGNCKYKCERYDCETCKVLKYKDPYVATGNCSIWSDGLEYNVDYAGKLYGDKLSFKIYYEVGKDASPEEEHKLYKMGNEESSKASGKSDNYVNPPTTIDTYTIHSLLSG